MDFLDSPDWFAIFVPSVPLLETFIRGSLMYLGLFLLMRVMRRQSGSLGPADLLVLLLIADAAQNGMAGEYKSVTDGLLLVMTIMFWEYALDWLAYHFPAMEKLIERGALVVIEDGRINRNNLRRELLTENDLISQLRQKGVDDVGTVKCCRLEGDGHISVVIDGPPSRQMLSSEKTPEAI